MSAGPDILIVKNQCLDAGTLRRLVDRFFGDMVKLVVDIKRQVVAVGGELHADAEALLLEDGSEQDDLWGANYYPGPGLERVLRLTDLTVSCVSARSRRRELLRWRDLAAELYLQPRPAARDHEAAFRCLLRFTPAAFEQSRLLLG
jgi:hypothetical protein